MQNAIAHYWQQSDQFGHAIDYLLFIMSLACWTLILAKAWTFWRVRQAAVKLASFWQAPSINDAVTLLRFSDKEELFVSLAQAAVDAAEPQQYFATLCADRDVSEVLTRALRQALQNATIRLENGLTSLASIGATAPFVGLLGTVWGIYHALTNISLEGAVQIDQLAGPVGEALIMTALGLMVAIPAVLAFNVFNRINRISLAELDGFAHDLHVHLSRQREQNSHRASTQAS